MFGKLQLGLKYASFPTFIYIFTKCVGVSSAVIMLLVFSCLFYDKFIKVLSSIKVCTWYKLIYTKVKFTYTNLFKTTYECILVKCYLYFDIFCFHRKLKCMTIRLNNNVKMLKQ